MFPSACGGSVVSATGEALLQSIDAAALNDSSRPLRSCTSRLSRGEKEVCFRSRQVLPNFGPSTPDPSSPEYRGEGEIRNSLLLVPAARRRLQLHKCIVKGCRFRGAKGDDLSTRPNRLEVESSSLERQTTWFSLASQWHPVMTIQSVPTGSWSTRLGSNVKRLAIQ